MFSQAWTKTFPPLSKVIKNCILNRNNNIKFYNINNFSDGINNWLEMSYNKYIENGMDCTKNEYEINEDFDYDNRWR